MIAPHISGKMIQDVADKYGIKSAFYKSMILAEFMESGEEGEVIPLNMLNRCFERAPVQNKDPEQHAFCDFAAGGDENVLALRTGNSVKILKAWRDSDTMTATGEFIAQFRKHGLRPEMISGDNGGLGHVMIDRMSELGWSINRVDNGNKNGIDKIAYFNMGAQIWGNGRNMIERFEVVLPQDDDELIKQLTTRQWKFCSDGALKLETKEDMKSPKRNLPSPDRAEAVLGALMPSPERFSKGIDTSWQDDRFLETSWGDQEEEFNEQGMNVGM